MDDTLIVGGGLIGCAVAAELASRGQRVTVLERGEPGDEASGAAAGMLTPQVEARADSPFFRLSLESRNRYPSWVETLREETDLDVGFRRCGLLRCVFRRGDAPLRATPTGGSERRRACGSKRGRPRRSRRSWTGGSRARCARRFSFPTRPRSTRRLLTRAAWLSAQRRGVRVRTGVIAHGASGSSAGICRGVETDERRLPAAGTTVDAAGAWAAFDPSVRVADSGSSRSAGQIVQLRVEGPPLRTMVCSEEVYLVPRPDGTVLLGSTVELVGFRKAVTAEAVERLISAAVALVPALRSAQFLSAWSGLRPGTPDGLPLLGESGVPGLVLATGHFRNGILLAPATAVVIADLLTGRTPRDLSAFAVARFSGCPGKDPAGRVERGSRDFG